MPETCLIIPCYNESARLDVETFIQYYEQHPEVHLWFVNDGSKDGTLEIINSVCTGREDRIRCIDHARNKGKGEAIRTGVLEAIRQDSFDSIGFTDADLSTPLHEFNRLRGILNSSSGCQMVFGSRFRRLGSTIVRNPYRHFFSRIFATIASLLLGLGIYDTQCGAKIIKTDLARHVFSPPFKSRWLFDIELFFRIIDLLGLEKVKAVLQEVPLNEWIDRGNSRISIVYFFLAPFDLLRLAIRNKLK